MEGAWGHKRVPSFPFTRQIVDFSERKLPKIKVKLDQGPVSWEALENTPDHSDTEGDEK